jgi:hypothetical protein
MVGEKRDHVIRAVLPWRSVQLTECGRELADVASAITRDQFIARVKEYGKQRTAFTVCMTCWNTASTHRYERWDTDPIGVIGREAERCGIYRVYVSQSPERDQLIAELRAIEARPRSQDSNAGAAMPRPLKVTTIVKGYDDGRQSD